jgi:putative ABC transport system permease protein
MSYMVTRRTHEIGIRMALGSRANHMVWMVVREGMRVTTVGLVIGLAGAWGLTRFLEALLFSVTPTDSITLVAVSLAVLLSAAAASYIPARRASRVDPMVALREE